MQLRDRVAMVTGGAHRVGRAIALALAEGGADVVVHYGRSAEAAQSTQSDIEAMGRRAWTFSADLADPEAIESLFGEVDEHCGRLDLLVNSAASFQSLPFEAIGVDDFDHVLAVNLRAPLLCTQRAAPRMRASRRADDEPALVVNISDLSGLQAWPGYAHHGASKAGLLQLTRSAARELAPEIRVNAVVPGAILPHPGQDPESEAWKRTGQRLPVGRTGDPPQIGQTVRFLADNDFITGETITVDGGEALLGAGHR